MSVFLTLSVSYMPVSLCMYVYLCMSASIFVCLCLSVAVCVCPCLSVCVSVSFSISRSDSLCLGLSFSLCISLCLFLSACLPVSVSRCISPCSLHTRISMWIAAYMCIYVNSWYMCVCLLKTRILSKLQSSKRLIFMWSVGGRIFWTSPVVVLRP